MRYQRVLKFLSAVLASVLFLFHGNVYAAECKGSSKSSCTGNSACTWVSSYAKKDGSKVGGYCRSKGKSGASSSKKSGGTSSKKSSEKTDMKAKSTRASDKKTTDKKTSDKKTKSSKPKDKKVKDTKSTDKKAKDTKSKDK